MLINTFVVAILKTNTLNTVSRFIFNIIQNFKDPMMRDRRESEYWKKPSDVRGLL
jgi:hypothetical protein